MATVKLSAHDSKWRKRRDLDNIFEYLKERGLQGTELVISDAHKGLVSAIRKSFTNVSWQRCQVHFLRNIFTTIPKNSKSFREAVKGIFKFTDINLARKAKID